MKILIVEDEFPIAEDLQALTYKILGERITSIHIETTLEGALYYLSERVIDVLLLDLNLNGEDGFTILKEVVSRSFHTIIISAHIDRAIMAFEYGVLDFIPKPYNEARLARAFKRLEENFPIEGKEARYLCVKKYSEIIVVPIREVKFFRGANVYTELHLISGRVELYDKILKNLGNLLPSYYFRIHKSYIVDIHRIKKIMTFGSGKYEAVLETGDRLPVSRHRIRELKDRFNLVSN